MKILNFVLVGSALEFTQIFYFRWTNTVIFCRHLIPALIFCWIGIQTWPKGRKWKNDIVMSFDLKIQRYKVETDLYFFFD